MYWKSRNVRRRKFREQFGENLQKSLQADWVRSRLDKIRIYHEELLEEESQIKTNQSVESVAHEMPGDEQKVNILDDITWNDLDMDEVFVRINHTKSFLGEQVLYRRLHLLDNFWEDEKTEEQVEKESRTIKQQMLEDKICYLSEAEEVRLDIEERLWRIGKSEGHYHLPTFFMHANDWQVQNGMMLRALQVLLMFFFAGSILSEHPFFVIGLAMVILINLMVYLYTKQQYEVFLYSLGSLKEIFCFCDWMLSDKERYRRFGNEQVEKAGRELKRLSRKIIKWQGRKSAGIAGDLVSLMQDYLMGITLIDVATFNQIVRVIGNRQEQVRALYEFAGEIDMLIAIASFRKSLDCWCVPRLISGVNEKQGIIGGAIAHPLLEHPIANDFCLQNRAIITGANASGKSTFMKALAVNVILAQTIGTCVAKEFQTPKINVMTSMALRDDILTGESYYVKEIKYLKRMLDAMKKVPVLCVIDEILKGTNTSERLAASEAILKYMAEEDGFVLIATHDKELVEKLQGIYETYYFESRIEERDIKFDYRIREGKGGASNAIALLSLFEFPEKVIEHIKAG